MKKAPDKQRLVLCFSEQDISKLPGYSKDPGRQQALIELARKWVRYGCAETPNEALRMLLGGVLVNRYYTIDAETIAGGLQKSKRVSRGTFVACCPAHDDQTPSLSIKNAPNGMILAHCHAGCSQDEVIGALCNLGLWHKQSRQRIKSLKNQGLKEEIRRNKIILALARSEYEQDVVHTERDRARIKRAIRFLERHGNG